MRLARSSLAVALFVVVPLAGTALTSVAVRAQGPERVRPAATSRSKPAAESEDPFPPGTSGEFASLDLRSGRWFRVNPAGCATRFPPYSTFKIPNSLIGLETGVVTDPDEKWHWDADRYPLGPNAPGGSYPGLWKQDNSLRTALANSIVWFYRELALRVGAARMANWLATFDYGNRDISGGLDHFWLGSSLRISPDEQVGFLAALDRGAFPVSAAHLSLVQSILAWDAPSPGESLVAKTGSSMSGEGWLVGWAEGADRRCAFALHVVAASYAEMAAARPPLALAFLRRAGCLARE